MTAAYVLVGTCLLTMGGALVWGFTVGDFWGEGAVLMGLPWGVISVIDVYTGGALFAGWIAFRERSVVRVIGWVLGIILLGHFATAAYALLALVTSGRDAERFWMGARRARAGPTGQRQRLTLAVVAAALLVPQAASAHDTAGVGASAGTVRDQPGAVASAVTVCDVAATSGSSQWTSNRRCARHSRTRVAPTRLQEQKR